MTPKRTHAALIVDALFEDWRDRAFLKWVFSKHPTTIFPGVDSIGLDVQQEIRTDWEKIIACKLKSRARRKPCKGGERDNA